MTVVGHGEIQIEVNDRGAISDLERVREQYRRTMAAIDNEEARARIDANIRPFERKVEEARRELRKLQGERAANIKVGADTKELDAKVKKAALEVKRLDGQKATVELRVAGERRVLDAEKRLMDAQAKRSAAEAASEKQRLAAINKQARVSAALRRQEQQEMASAHADAMRMDRERDRSIYEQTVGIAKQRSQVVELQRQYAKLTDQAERLNRTQRFTTEGRAKLNLDRQGVEAKMLAIKAELNALGAHPPVDIKVDIARTTLGRVKQDFGRMIAGMAESASRLGEMSVRIGPFTTSLKGLGVALAFLGPTITDIAGALGSLIGVTGAGLAGAATVGSAAVTGLGLGFLGLKFSVRNAGQEITNARSTIDAYQKAVEKYGASSDQAKKKQDEMNHTLKSISPLAREAALGIERFYTNWDRHTEKTRESFGNIAKNGFQALNRITPMWARSTNELAGILDRNLAKAFDFTKTSEFKNNFSAITENFNAMMPGILRGLGSLGRAFLNFGREGSRFLPQMGRGFENLSKSLLRFTQRDDFGKIVDGWVDSAKDLGRFFSAATQVAVHFFGAGTRAGQGLLKSMTAALNKYDDFLTSAGGQEKVAAGFERAADGARALWNALAPIAGAFITWASNLSPVITGFTTVFSFVSKVIGAMGKVAGLAGAWSAVGATIGAAFAVSKISGFVAGLARVVTLLRSIKGLSDIGKLGGIAGAFRGAGKLGGMEAGGAAAAAEMRAGIVSGGAVAAAELRAAMIGGGAAGGALGGVDDVIGGMGRRGKAVSTVARDVEKAGESALKSGAKFGIASTAASALTGALGGIGLASIAIPLGLTAAGGAALYFGSKLIFSGNAAQDAQKHYEESKKSASDASVAYESMAQSSQQVALTQSQAAFNLKEAKRALDDTKKGTLAHRQAMLSYRQAAIDADRADSDWNKTKRAAEQTAQKQTLATEKQAVAANKAVEAAKKAQQSGPGSMHPEAAQERVNKALEVQRQLQEKVTAAQNRQAAVASNYARIYRGLTPLLGQAEQKIGALARSAPKLAKTVSVKYETSGDVSKVAASANRALTAGVPKRIVTKIVADSKDAEGAVARLNSKTKAIQDKKIKLSASDSASAQVSGLQRRITGVPASHNTNLKASDNASGLIGGVVGKIKGIPDGHNTTVKATDNASGVIGRVLGMVNSMPASKTTVLTTILRTVRQAGGTGGSGTGHGGAAGNAMGGRFADANVPPAGQARIDRAFKDAFGKEAGDTRSQKITAPRFLVGEERNHPEYVIATNPAYKKNNLRFLGQAARALGQEIIPAAVGFGGKGKLNQGAYASNAIPMSNVAKTKKRIAKMTKKGGKKAVFKRQNMWSSYIDSLQTAEDDWTRELSIRQGEVREPEDMIVQTGTKPVVDDKGKPVLDDKGKQVTAPVYAANPKIEQEYLPDLQKVLEAFKQLLHILRALVQAVPMALASNAAEIKFRSGTVGDLDREIARNAKRMHAAKGDKKEPFQKAISKAKDKRDKEKRTISDLRDDSKELVGLRKESGFSLREQTDAKADVQREHDSVLGKQTSAADKQTADEYASATGAGGGGTSDTGSSATDAGNTRSQDLMLADSARSDLYKTFGSNSAAAGARSGGSAALASPNLMPNAGAMGTIIAPGSGGGGAAGVMLQTASVGSALGGSAAAGQAISAPRAASVVGNMGAPSGAASSTTVVNINNTFATVPPDPHSWSKGVQFELGAAL